MTDNNFKNVCMDSAMHVYSSPIRAWKESHKKIVGYTCSLLPAEILYAAEMLPVRIRGIETDRLDIGDTYFGPYICTFPKCMLQLAGENKFSFLDGVIITDGCDSMRRLDECWRKAGEDFSGIIPSFFYYFGVPHKSSQIGIDWFVEELISLRQAIKTHFNVLITDEKLQNAISTYNKTRKLFRKLAALRNENSSLISGTDVFSIMLAAGSMPRDIFNQLFEAFLVQLALETKSETERKEKKRIVIAGSANDDLSFIKIIEDSGAIVVGEHICFGTMRDTVDIDETKDPYHALAEHYLLRSVCPRMFGKYNDRFQLLKDLIKNSNAQGVILQNIRFCDLHGSENGLMERELEKQGIPCLRIEREYGTVVEIGRLSLRIQAFLEKLNLS